MHKKENALTEENFTSYRQRKKDCFSSVSVRKRKIRCGQDDDVIPCETFGLSNVFNDLQRGTDTPVFVTS